MKLRTWSRLAGLLVAAWVAAGVAACTKPPPPSRPPSAIRLAPKIEDAIAADTDMVFVVRPRALLRDKVFGPLLREATDLASARAGIASVGATALMAFERSEEIVVATRRASFDAIVGIRGAPADLDPAHLVDTDGRPLWRSHAELRPGVFELTSESDPSKAELFELDARTWVIAIGDGMERARSAFAASQTRTRELNAEGDELGRVLLAGDALRRLRPDLNEGALAPILQPLDHAVVALLPGEEGQLRFTLTYATAANAAASEGCARDVVQAFRRKVTQSETADAWSFVAAARVQRVGDDVSVQAPLPRSWLLAAIHAGRDLKGGM